MEKLMYLLWKDSPVDKDAFRDHLLTQASSLQQAGAMQLRITAVDSDVAPADKLRLQHLKPGPHAVVSFWLSSATHRQSAETLLVNNCLRVCGYLVTESEPLANTQHPAIPGQRTHGMNQVVLLRRPEKLSPQEWIRIWHDSHTRIALETQSTFGYRQNVVARALTENAPPVDAIVEENFPPEAMISAHAFYDAIGDDARLQQNRKTLFESVQRFVDLARLDCLPMSEYNF